MDLEERIAPEAILAEASRHHGRETFCLSFRTALQHGAECNRIRRGAESGFPRQQTINSQPLFSVTDMEAGMKTLRFALHLLVFVPVFRLPREFRFEEDEVLIRRVGKGFDLR